MYIYTMHAYIYIYSIHVHIYMHIYTCIHCMGITTPPAATNQPPMITHTLHNAYTHMQFAYTHTQYYITFHMHSALNHRTLPLFGINRASIKACIGPVLALYPCHSNMQAQAGMNTG